MQVSLRQTFAHNISFCQVRIAKTEKKSNRTDDNIICKETKKRSLVTSLGCGGSTRTSDLQVMSLASYRLLHPAMFCECKGTPIYWNSQMFNPKNAFWHIIQAQKRHKVLNMCKN